MNWWTFVPRLNPNALMLCPVLLSIFWSPAALAQFTQNTEAEAAADLSAQGPMDAATDSDASSDLAPDLTPTENSPVDFAADQLDYDENLDVVTATGNVEMEREGNHLRADVVVWDRVTGKVTATGNVRVINPGGDVAYGDSVDLQDTLKDGVAENMLLVLTDGGRLAALHGERTDGVTKLNRASYTPCHVVDSKGCAKKPLWKIDALRVIHDPVKHRIRYRHARLSLLGMPVLSLPALSHPDGSGNGGTGFLVPDLRYRLNNGFELVTPYYIRFSANRDLLLTPHVYSITLPMLGVVYRQLTSSGAYQIKSNLTYSTRQTVPLSGPSKAIKDVRGNFDISGKFQLSPLWNISGSGRVTTDKTFLQRYYISGDDRLRTTARAERVGPNSYLSIAGWAVQDLRPGSIQGNQPVALPLIDYRLRLADPVLSGALEFQANSLSLVRTAGQDTQRAFASFKWEKRSLTPMGQELSLTTYGRADVYNANDTLDTRIALYRGSEGWSKRVIGAVAADMRWPLLGPALGGTQLITPRVQIAASPNVRNLSIPNEDSRAIELEDSNLFALNRFPGYDRWEDGARITYGAEYGLNLPRFSLRSVVGQSYRLNSRTQLFPDGTGLSGRMSDIVGRNTLAYGDLLKFTHRFRLDKNNFSVRRNEFDATIGTKRTYAMVGYLRLNRNIDASIEDLRDREELRLGARVAINRFWSVYTSSVIILTGKSEDPTTKLDGYQPLRNATGIAYEDECFIFSATLRHDRAGLGDARIGNTMLFRLAFKNLGR